MHEHGTDLSVVDPTTNMRYLTGYSPMAVERITVLLVTVDAVAMVMPYFDALAVRDDDQFVVVRHAELFHLHDYRRHSRFDFDVDALDVEIGPDHCIGLPREQGRHEVEAHVDALGVAFLEGLGRRGSYRGSRPRTAVPAPRSSHRRSCLGLGPASRPQP